MLHRIQPNGRASSIVLESGPTRSLVAKPLYRSFLAVREFRTASEKCCEQGCLRNFDAKYGA